MLSQSRLRGDDSVLPAPVRERSRRSATPRARGPVGEAAADCRSNDRASWSRDRVEPPPITDHQEQHSTGSYTRTISRGRTPRPWRGARRRLQSHTNATLGCTIGRYGLDADFLPRYNASRS